MNQFDKHIRERFENFQAEVPADMWERIAGKTNDRKPGGWWNWKNAAMIGGIILMLGIGGTIAYKHFNSSDNSTAAVNEKNTARENTALNKERENINAKSGSNALPDQHIVSYDQNKTGEDDLTKNDKLNSSDPNKTSSNNPSFQSLQKKINPDADQISSNKNSSKSLTNNSTTKAISSPGKSPAFNNAGFGIDQDQNQNDGLVVSRNRNQKHQPNKTKIKIIASEPEGDEALETVKDEYAGLKLKITTAELLKTSLQQELKTAKHPVLSFIPCPKAEKNAAGNKRYFEFYGGYDFALRSFEDTGNSNYLQKRKESLQQSSAFSAGLRYTKVFNNGMSIRTGLNYSQINEKFKYVDAHIIRTEYIINDNGDTIGSFLSSSSRYKLTHNKYRSIDIPLLVGYEWGNGNFHFNLNAGPVINIYSWQKGDVLDSDLNPVSITTGKNNSAYGFRTNTGLGVMASLSAYYKINERLHFLAEPYFRYNFSQVNKFDITLKQKYNLAGLRLGLRYDF